MTTKFTVVDIDETDIMHNLAGIDEHWLVNAPMRDLLRVIRELRDQARTILHRKNTA